MVKPLVAFLFGGLIAAFAAMSIDRGREAAAYQAGRDSEIAARAGRTHTLYDLSVIRRHTDKKFTLEFKPFVVDLCPDGQPVDWQEGDSLRGWTFDQMADCKASKYFTTNTDRDSGERIKYARAGLP